MKHRFWVVVFALVCFLLPQSVNGAAEEPRYIFDQAQVLSAEETSRLEEQARAISERSHCTVAVLTTTDRPSGSEVEIDRYAENFFEEKGLGAGEGQNGILLVLDLVNRDYVILAHGDYANGAFTDANKDRMAEAFLPELAEDAWADAFDDYMASAEQYLTLYAQEGSGAKESKSLIGYALSLIAIPLPIAWLVSAGAKRKMKSAGKRTTASEYQKGGGFVLQRQTDQFVDRTESRISTGSSSTNTSTGASKSRGTTTVISRGYSSKKGKF